jgi:hypothetical protein
MSSPDAGLLTSPRRLWYKAALDPAYQAKMTEAHRGAVRDFSYEEDDALDALQEPDWGHPYNLISSLREDGLHSPALDIDSTQALASLFDWLSEEDVAVMVPSSTPDHWHAYMPSRVFTWPEYIYFLEEMKEHGVIEEGYHMASLKRRQTVLRPPHIKKHHPEPQPTTT